MDTPDPSNIQKPLNIENFNLVFEDKNCILTINKMVNALKFSLEFEGNLNNIYEGNFSYEELNELSSIFKIFNNIDEIEKSLKQAISSKKIELSKIKESQINLNFKENIFGKIIDISIPLNQREIDQKEIIQILLKENKDLRNEIINLKEENKNIKLTLDSLNKKFNEFELFKNDLLILKKQYYFDSSLISITIEQNNFLINRLKFVEQFRNKKYFEFNLLYRGTRDGDDSIIFHELCDNKNNILVLIETTKKRKFGGFCSIGYKSFGDSQIDNSAFIFSLDKLKVYNVIKNKTAVFWNSNYGAMFAGSISSVSNKFFNKDCFANRKNIYYQMSEDFEYNGGEQAYRIKEIEVYQIY